jgi:hypothetical protein
MSLRSENQRINLRRISPPINTPTGTQKWISVSTLAIQLRVTFVFWLCSMSTHVKNLKRDRAAERPPNRREIARANPIGMEFPGAMLGARRKESQRARAGVVIASFPE